MIPKVLFPYGTPVRILPLEGCQGIVTEISLRLDAQYRVRYFTEGQERMAWLYESELVAEIPSGPQPALGETTAVGGQTPPIVH